MGVPLERVELLQSDTTAVSYDRSTGASRTTTIVGLAIQAAARGRPGAARRLGQRDARRRAGGRGGSGWRRSSTASSTTGARSSGPGSPGRAARPWAAATSGGPARPAAMPPFWEIGCVGVEVSVDETTGQVRVERLVTVGDVGCAINPQLVEIAGPRARRSWASGIALTRGARLLGRGQPPERQPRRLPGPAGRRHPGRDDDPRRARRRRRRVRREGRRRGFAQPGRGGDRERHRAGRRASGCARRPSPRSGCGGRCGSVTRATEPREDG